MIAFCANENIVAKISYHVRGDNLAKSILRVHQE
jgi:hypothetical protein